MYFLRNRSIKVFFVSIALFYFLQGVNTILSNHNSKNLTVIASEDRSAYMEDALPYVESLYLEKGSEIVYWQNTNVSDLEIIAKVAIPDLSARNSVGETDPYVEFDKDLPEYLPTPKFKVAFFKYIDPDSGEAGQSHQGGVMKNEESMLVAKIPLRLRISTILGSVIRSSLNSRKADVMSVFPSSPFLNPDTINIISGISKESDFADKSIHSENDDSYLEDVTLSTCIDNYLKKISSTNYRRTSFQVNFRKALNSCEALKLSNPVVQIDQISQLDIEKISVTGTVGELQKCWHDHVVNEEKYLVVDCLSEYGKANVVEKTVLSLGRFYESVPGALTTSLSYTLGAFLNRVRTLQ